MSFRKAYFPPGDFSGKSAWKLGKPHASRHMDAGVDWHETVSLR